METCSWPNGLDQFHEADLGRPAALSGVAPTCRDSLVGYRSQSLVEAIRQKRGFRSLEGIGEAPRHALREIEISIARVNKRLAVGIEPVRQNFPDGGDRDSTLKSASKPKVFGLPVLQPPARISRSRAGFRQIGDDGLPSGDGEAACSAGRHRPHNKAPPRQRGSAMIVLPSDFRERAIFWAPVPRGGGHDHRPEPDTLGVKRGPADRPASPPIDPPG